MEITLSLPSFAYLRLFLTNLRSDQNDKPSFIFISIFHSLFHILNFFTLFLHKYLNTNTKLLTPKV